MMEEDKTSYYLQDEMGSPIRFADEEGILRDSYGYDEFGNDLYGNQGAVQPFGYTGYRHDKISGTYYAQEREYLAGEGRFGGEDIIKGSIDMPFTLHHYGYCWNNPNRYVDVNGKNPLSQQELLEELTKAVDGYINDGQKLKTMPFNTNVEALDIVLKYDQQITDAASEYGVPKEMVQAILFQEIRFYGVDDPISDSLVVQSYAYEQQLEDYCEWMQGLKWYELWKGLFRQAPSPVMGYRTDSSTGLGQIYASTAIDALNARAESEVYKKESWRDYKMIWDKLQDDEYNIDMVALVLWYKATLKKVDLQNMSNDEIKEVLMAYNGSGDWAKKYADVTMLYYNAFLQYNNCELE